MREQATRTLAGIVSQELHQLSIDRQIAAYQALAVLMPTKEEREAAKSLATRLSGAAAAQLEFKEILSATSRRHNQDGERE